MIGTHSTNPRYLQQQTQISSMHQTSSSSGKPKNTLNQDYLRFS